MDIPHVTIASTKDFKLAKQLCDDLNRTGVQAEAWLSTKENEKGVEFFATARDLAANPSIERAVTGKPALAALLERQASHAAAPHQAP